MKWVDRLLSGAAMVVAKAIVVSVFAYFGFTSDLFHALWLLFRDSAAWLQIVIWTTLGLAVIGLLLALSRRPIDAQSPDSLSRYFWLYLAPFWRISWRFERLFNCDLDYEKRLRISNFPFCFKANWGGDLSPTYAVVRSRVTGRSIEISIAGPSPPGGYVPASEIESCASGVWVNGVAEFSPPIYADKFMEEFGDFDFIFKYGTHDSFRLYFSKKEVQRYLDRWQRFFDERKRQSIPTVRVKP